MKRVYLIGLVLLSTPLYGQTFYKTDYELATERLGVVYSVSSKEICEFQYQSITNYKTTKATSRLDTFEDAKTKERIQRVLIRFSKGLSSITSYDLSLNCSEINDLITAVAMIEKNHELLYNSKTANLRLKWWTPMIEIDVARSDSVPGDLRFITLGYVTPEEMIKMLERVKEVADMTSIGNEQTE